MTYNDELYHYGVLGMKWGVRRQRRLAKSAYRASGNMFGEKRRKDMIEKGRKHDAKADRLEGQISKLNTLKKNAKNSAADAAKYKQAKQEIDKEHVSTLIDKLDRIAKVSAGLSAVSIAAFVGTKIYEMGCSYVNSGKLTKSANMLSSPSDIVLGMKHWREIN